MSTQNQHLAKARAAYQAAIANRELIDPHDLASSGQIVENSITWLREAYRLVKTRPDLAEYLERSAASLKALQRRLADEAQRGQGRAH